MTRVVLEQDIGLMGGLIGYSTVLFMGFGHTLNKAF